MFDIALITGFLFSSTVVLYLPVFLSFSNSFPFTYTFFKELSLDSFIISSVYCSSSPASEAIVIVTFVFSSGSVWIKFNGFPVFWLSPMVTLIFDNSLFAVTSTVAWTADSCTKLLYVLSSILVASKLFTFIVLTLLSPDFTVMYNWYSYSVPSAAVNLTGTSKYCPSSIFCIVACCSPTDDVPPFISMLVVSSCAFA